MKKSTLWPTAAFIFLCATLNAQISPDNWTQYCGWHYGAGNAPAWGGWVREYAKDGFGLFISDTVSLEMDTTALQESYDLLTSLDVTTDVMQLDGGLGSARDTAQVIRFMNLLQADQGNKWKKIVFTQARKLTGLPDAGHRVYWQIGNEISSPAWSRTLRYWQGQPYSNGINYDSFVIPYYVENYLAPTVEAIDSASMAVYGEKGRIKIALGSITNAHNPAAQNFLQQLLNYPITGTYAPSLAGLKVYDLVDIITIHYAIGTAGSADWDNLLTFYKNWSGNGRIEGVWSTEEVGINAAMSGRGSFAGSIATTRYLEWAIAHQASSKEVRTNYFGWNTGAAGTTVNNLNTFLLDQLGQTRLRSVAANFTAVYADQATEQHGFSTASGDQGILFLFPERIQGQNTTATLSHIAMSTAGWGNIQEMSVYQYNDTGINLIPFSSIFTTDSVQIQFSPSAFLANTDGLMVLLTTGGSSSVHNAPTLHNSIHVFPNPAASTLQITSSGQNQLTGNGALFDASGTPVKGIDLPSNGWLDISDMMPGVYFIRLEAAPGVVLKWVKE